MQTNGRLSCRISFRRMHTTTHGEVSRRLHHKLKTVYQSVLEPPFQAQISGVLNPYTKDCFNTCLLLGGSVPAFSSLSFRRRFCCESRIPNLLRCRCSQNFRGCYHHHHARRQLAAPLSEKTIQYLQLRFEPFRRLASGTQLFGCLHGIHWKVLGSGIQHP